MSVRFTERVSSLAKWSLWLSLLAVQILVITFLLHRFATLSTPVAVNLFAVSFILAGVAVVLGAIALRRIWRRGETGVGRIAISMLFGLLIVGFPAGLAVKYWKVPGINDITTDAQSPPPFAAAAKLRGFGENPVAYPGEAIAVRQGNTYPEILPILTNRSSAEVYDLVRELIDKRGWTILAEKSPAAITGVGLIEAVEKTQIMGFEDDISIRVTGGSSRARVDVRSASRFGSNDLGRNAQRVHQLLIDLQNKLNSNPVAAADDPSAEDAAAAVISSSKKSDSQAQVLRNRKQARARARAKDALIRKVKPQPQPFGLLFGIGQQR